MSTPLVSVVLLNWNGADVAASAAGSVRGQTRSNTELVVVDNASTDDSLRLIRHRAEPDVVVTNDTNLGFAAGMNAGVAAASGDVVVLLNHDAALAEDFADTAVQLFEAHPDAGILGGRVVEVDALVHADGRAVADGGDAQVAVGARGFTASMRLWERSDTLSAVVPAVGGAAPALRLDFIADVNARFGALFDTTYDTYGEDVDLFARAPHTGWTVRYEPTLRAVHLGSHASQKRVSDKRGRLRTNVVRNRHRNVTRHSRPRRVLVNRSIAIAEDLGFVALRLARRDTAVLADVAAAWRGAIGLHGDDTAFRRLHGGLPRSVDGPRYRPLARW